MQCDQLSWFVWDHPSFTMESPTSRETPLPQESQDDWLSQRDTGPVRVPGSSSQGPEEREGERASERGRGRGVLRGRGGRSWMRGPGGSTRKPSFAVAAESPGKRRAVVEKSSGFSGGRMVLRTGTHKGLMFRVAGLAAATSRTPPADRGWAPACGSGPHTARPPPQGRCSGAVVGVTPLLSCSSGTCAGGPGCLPPPGQSHPADHAFSVLPGKVIPGELGECFPLGGCGDVGEASVPGQVAI